MKTMLQSKESDQLETLHGVRLTHVVVVISVFPSGRFLPNSFFLPLREAERG